MKKKIHEFFFFISSSNDKILLIDKVQLIVLYTVNILSVSALLINLPHIIASKRIITSGIWITTICLMLSSFFVFFKTRKLFHAQVVETAAVLILLTDTIIFAGGPTGIGIIYFIGSLSLAYFVLGFRAGLIVPLYLLAGMIIRLSLFDVSANSIFFQPEVKNGFYLAIIFTCLFGILASISFRMLVNHLSTLAFRDFVTKLPNKNKIEEYLRNRVDESIQFGNHFSLIGIKILNFNKINSNLGTEQADHILKEISRRLTSLNVKFTGRWSGSIFLIITDKFRFEEIDGFCRKLLSALSESYPVNQNRTTMMQFVCAITRFPDDAGQSEYLLENIIALLERQDSLPGDIIFFNHENQIAEHKRFYISELLNQVDLDREFYLVYQPKFDLADKICIGAEVLLRWKSREMDSIPPDIFIPLAEESGFIKTLTRWVIRKTFMEMKKHRTACDPDFVYAINISVADLMDREFIPFIKNELERSGCSSEIIELELTERVLIHDDPQIKACLGQIANMGFRIAIDDFGTGYSSLSYLHNMKANNLKIDKSFINKIVRGYGSVTYPVIDAIISMGISMGMEITAEGIETKEQEDYLKKKGCHSAQGWLFGKPMPIKQLIDMYNNSDKKTGIETTNK